MAPKSAKSAATPKENESVIPSRAPVRRRRANPYARTLYLIRKHYHIRDDPVSKLIEILVLELAEKYQTSYRLEASALDVLQSASETFMDQLFERLNSLAAHADRVTILPQDLAVLRSMSDGFKMVGVRP